jgi:hypothetical protein
MQHRSRRSFLTLAGLAAGTALVDVTRPGPFGFFAQGFAQLKSRVTI